MGKTFVEAKTEIDDLINQRSEILKKIANNVASAVLDRTRNDKLNGLSRDIDNLVNGLSDDEKYQVMLMVTIAIAKNKNGNNQGQRPTNNHRHSSDSSSRDSLFSRGF